MKVHNHSYPLTFFYWLYACHQSMQPYVNGKSLRIHQNKQKNTKQNKFSSDRISREQTQYKKKGIEKNNNR